MRNLLVILIILAMSFLAHAQRSRSQNKGKTLIVNDTKPFNLDTEQLPPQYFGHSYENLFTALVKRQKTAGKGEFESTIDYKARIARINEKPLLGTVNGYSLLAFNFYQDGGQFTSRYNADLTVLDINLTWKRAYAFGPDDVGLTWSEHSRKLGTYIGRNAFNRSVRVYTYRNDSFYLVAEPSSLVSIQGYKGSRYGDTSFETSAFMPPSDARAAKSNLRALVIGTLSVKPLHYDSSHDTPEITSPYDNYNFTYAIRIVVKEIWFYDFSTGNILLKLSNMPVNNDKPVNNNRRRTP